MGYDFEQAKRNNNIIDVIMRRVRLQKRGTEFYGICPFHDDHTESLQVNERKQIFKCFACGAGGDVIDFLLRYGLTYREAIEELTGGTTTQGAPEQRTVKRATRPRVVWRQIAPVANGADVDKIEHYRHGQPSRVWAYKDVAGNLLGFVCRFDMPDGNKEVLPYTYCTDGKRSEWRWQGFDKPRPLYNLHKLASEPDKTVIVVEGEKTADAVSDLIPTSVAVTWPGGSNGIEHADWSPLKGRKIILWPDNDAAGTAAMIRIAERLAGSAALIRWVPNPADAPKGWDAADAEWQPEEARKYVLRHLQDVPAPCEPPPGIQAQKYWQVQEVGRDTLYHLYKDARGDWHYTAKQADVTGRPQEQSAPPPATDAEPRQNNVEDASYQNNAEGASQFNTPYFRFLGYINEPAGPVHCFYAKRSRSVVQMPVNAMSEKNLINLADLNWWEENFPGNRSRMDDKAAANWLVNMSSRVGVFSEKVIRGRGAWHDDGRTVVHAGSHLIVDGKRVTLGDFKTRYIYEVGEPLGFNTENPLSAEEAARLLDVLKLIHWERPVNPYLLAGWCVVAPVCGALSWRPHVWITGAAGTGKTWVFTNIVRRLLGETVLAVQGETSEAGLRQSLRHDALPVVFDEAEGEDKKAQERIQAILTLMRTASAEDGGIMAKGSAGGNAITYRIRSCFAFASIGLGLSQQSDRSRVTVLGILKPPPEMKDARWKELNRLYAEVITPDFVSRLHARTIALLPTILKNARIFAAAGAAEIGEQRAGDQLGALLAGAFSLFSAKEITYEKAVAWIRERDWSEERGLDSTKDEINLFTHLMEQLTRIETGAGTFERNVGELVRIAGGIAFDESSSLTPDVAKGRLARLGFKIDGEYVVISNSADGVKRMLRDTPWQKNHNKILLRIEGARAVESTRFGSGLQTRAVAVPLSLMRDT